MNNLLEKGGEIRPSLKPALAITPKNARMFSMLGLRGSAFGVALPEIVAQRPETLVLIADLGLSSGLGTLQNQQPDNLLNLGIAEQNMVAVAAGLALGGLSVWATTYAPFLTMRAYEQIRDNLGYMGLNVKLAGAAAGLAMGVSGNTHYSLEDLALMRVIPNMTVLSPADGAEAYKMAFAASELDGPVYLRLTGVTGSPVIYKEEFELRIGRGHVLRQGSQIALVGTGLMVSECLKAADLLAERGLSATVVNFSTIKPLDTDLLDELFKSHQVVVTVEEHRRLGGMGSAVAEYAGGLKGACPQLIIGLPDQFPAPDEYGAALDQAGLRSEPLALKIEEFFHLVS